MGKWLKSQQTLLFEIRGHVAYITLNQPDKLAEALDPKWGGALPLTLLVAPGGEILWRTNDEIDPLTLRREIVKWLDAQGVK